MTMRTVDVEVVLSPEDLAQAFCEMGSDGMARFFNEVGRVSGERSPRLYMQMACVGTSKSLAEIGRAAMETIGSHARDVEEADA